MVLNQHHPDSWHLLYSLISGEDTTSVLCGFTITGGTGTYRWITDSEVGGGINVFESGAKIM